MWTPIILKTEDDATLVWIAAPFEKGRISGDLLGRTLIIDGVPHRVETVMADGLPREEPIRKGELISLRVRPISKGESQSA